MYLYPEVRSVRSLEQNGALLPTCWLTAHWLAAIGTPTHRTRHGSIALRKDNVNIQVMYRKYIHLYILTIIKFTLSRKLRPFTQSIQDFFYVKSFHSSILIFIFITLAESKINNIQGGCRPKRSVKEPKNEFDILIVIKVDCITSISSMRWLVTMCACLLLCNTKTTEQNLMKLYTNVAQTSDQDIHYSSSFNSCSYRL